MAAYSTKNSIKIAPGATVCNESDLRGDITIGALTVVHPRACIIAEAGPIIIGDNNLIEDQARIVNRLGEGEAPPQSTPVMLIGANNVFEVDSHCEALRVGDSNVLECKAWVGRRIELSHGCVVGAGCHLSEPESMEQSCVVYGRECCRRIRGDRPTPQTLQLDFLHKVMPNYHHLRKPQRSQK